MNNYYLRALDQNGSESYYTGKAGKNWISINRDDAFLYQSKEAAQRKATAFNRMTEIHGLRFIVLAY